MTERVQFIESNQIQLGIKLGEGSFGVVHKATFQGKDVAVKRLKLNDMVGEVFRDFLTEAKIMMSLRNPVVAQLVGIIKTKPYGLVLEYMPGGDLKTLLLSKKALAWNMRWQIASDIAAGLRYLHKSNKLHRDLKSENILLDDKLRAKITDFGMVKTKQTSRETFTHNDGLLGSGTLMWMAPEQMTRKAKLTAKTDVYAYGIVLWEIGARRRPLEGIKALKDVVIKVRTGNRDPMPKEVPEPFTQLYKQCISLDPNKRPSSVQVYDSLQKHVDVPYSHDFEYELLKANKGSAISQYNVACRYFAGRGAKRDSQKAVEYFRESALRGDEDASYKLAQCLEKGVGAKEDFDQAVKFYGLAASAGHTGAHSRLGLLFLHGTKGYFANSRRAVIHFRAAVSSRGDACYHLAKCFKSGTGVKQSSQLMLKYFKQGAGLRHASCQHALGMMYLRGQGVDKNLSEAVRFLELAAKQKHGDACYQLGLCYADGMGVVKDLSKALNYLQEAEQRGVSKAKFKLKELKS